MACEQNANGNKQEAQIKSQHTNAHFLLSSAYAHQGLLFLTQIAQQRKSMERESKILCGVFPIVCLFKFNKLYIYNTQFTGLSLTGNICTT